MGPQDRAEAELIKALPIKPIKAEPITAVSNLASVLLFI